MKPLFSLLIATFLFSAALAAQPPATSSVAPATTSGPPGTLDPEAATRAYLATIPPAKRASSDRYFEGGYWLQLWNFLAGAGFNLALLATGLSARMRDLAERVISKRPLQVALYWIQYVVLSGVILFPLTFYEEYFREHSYGLSNQTIGTWSRDMLVGTLLEMLFGGFLMMALFAFLRRAPRTWWIWGAATVMAFMILGVVIAPVFISPLFNEYKRLEDPKVRDPILRLARQNGIGVEDIWVFDASRQSKRISANVSGLLGTERISLNDNLLRRTSLPEIEAVMAHEIGHYVLHHIYKMLLFFFVVIVGVFAVAKWGVEGLLARFGERWKLRGIDDPALVPLLTFVLITSFFILTPVMNSFIRIQESEADLFGLHSARQPEGFSEVSLKLGEYRKLDPTPLEEVLMFDHPSGRSRIRMAMEWKAVEASRSSGNGEGGR